MSKELNAFYKYQELVSQGMPFDQALQQSGLSNLALQRQKDEAGQAQKAEIGKLGGQLAGALGTQYATSTGLFAPAAAGTAATGAAATGAAATGTVAGTTATGTTATAMGSLGSVALPVAAAIAAAYLGNRAMEKHGRGRSLSEAFKSASKDPLSYIGPGFLGAAFGSAFKGGRAKFENKKMTSELLEMGFKPQDLAVFGRINDQGEIQQVKTTKAQQDEWKKLTQSEDPNVNPLKIPTAMWGAGGVLKTFGPDYFDKMNEFERYAASAAAIKSGQIFQDKGELKIQDQDLVRQTYEQLKQDPEMQARYNQWKQTGKDQGIV
jgi:hypothetical protein